MIRILELKSYLHIVENNKMFNVKDLVIEKIISCNVCDAEGKIIGETTRSLDDEPICHDYKNDDNITKIIDKN